MMTKPVVYTKNLKKYFPSIKGLVKAVAKPFILSTPTRKARTTGTGSISSKAY